MTLEEKRAKFIRKNGTYLLKYFKAINISTGKLSHKEKILFWIEKARKEVGYTGKDADVYRSLWKACKHKGREIARLRSMGLI